MYIGMSNYKVGRHGIGNGRYIIKLTRGHDASEAEICFMVTKSSLRQELACNQTNEFNLTAYSEDEVHLFLDAPHWLLIEHQHATVRVTLSPKSVQRLLRKLEHVAPGITLHVHEFGRSAASQ